MKDKKSKLRPPLCDFCREDGLLAEAYIDGKTHLGVWANMCPTCHVYSGVGLGVGKGQIIRREDDSNRGIDTKCG